MEIYHIYSSDFAPYEPYEVTYGFFDEEHKDEIIKRLMATNKFEAFIDYSTGAYKKVDIKACAEYLCAGKIELNKLDFDFDDIDDEEESK